MLTVKPKNRWRNLLLILLLLLGAAGCSRVDPGTETVENTDETIGTEETAETAGEAIQLLLKSLDTAAVEFSQLPAPTPAVQAELDAWFAEREHIMETMVQQVDRLQNEDPAFFGSQTLISAIVMVGCALGGAQ